MAASQTLNTVQLPSSNSTALKTFWTEATTLLDALLRPGRIIAEVEAMQALHREADRIEATDPARAAAARQRASRIGLR